MSKKLTAGLAALVFAIGAAFFLRGEKDKPKEFFPFMTKPVWIAGVSDSQDKKKTETRAWKFKDDGMTCFVFIQEQVAQAAYFPTASCWPSWLVW